MRYSIQLQIDEDKNVNPNKNNLHLCTFRATRILNAVFISPYKFLMFFFW